MATASAAADLQIIGMHKLAGGAIQENWHLEILANGGVFAGTVRLNLPPMRRHQLAIAQPCSGLALRACPCCRRGGNPHFLCSDDTIIGTPFFIMDYCSDGGRRAALHVIRRWQISVTGWLANLAARWYVFMP